MYAHYRKTRKKYTNNKRADTVLNCTYCQNITPDQLVRETEHCRLIRNRLPYDLWEYHPVVSHLLIIPKRHVHNLTEMTDAERLDLIDLCAEHELQGYSIYARSTDSPRRSVKHQHTHLIKIAPDVVKGGVYLKKPFINITF